MKYKSICGDVMGWIFEEVLFIGYVVDGGLIFLEIILKIDVKELKLWVKLFYVELVKKIVFLFVGEDEILIFDLSGKCIMVWNWLFIF